MLLFSGKLLYLYVLGTLESITLCLPKTACFSPLLVCLCVFHFSQTLNFMPACGEEQGQDPRSKKNTKVCAVTTKPMNMN